MGEKDIIDSARLKYKRVFYAWPTIGDGDFGARFGEIKITIESSSHVMPDDEIPEMIELLNELMDAKFMTKEMVEEEEKALQKHIDGYNSENQQPQNEHN
jgi:hypothetical protein